MDNLDAGAEFFRLQDSVSCKAMRFNKDALLRCKVQGKNGYFPIVNSVDSLLYNRLLQPEYIITLPFTQIITFRQITVTQEPFKYSLIIILVLRVSQFLFHIHPSWQRHIPTSHCHGLLSWIHHRVFICISKITNSNHVTDPWGKEPLGSN